MSFMQPSFYVGEIQIVETENGAVVSPLEFAQYDNEGAALAYDVDSDDIETKTGICWRLSAPGYLDCTDWTFAENLETAISDLLEMWGEELDSADWDIIGEHVAALDETGKIQERLSRLRSEFIGE